MQNIIYFHFYFGVKYDPVCLFIIIFLFQQNNHNKTATVFINDGGVEKVIKMSKY